MNPIDLAIEAVSPRWAAWRAYWRSTLEAVRAFEGAKSTRRTDGWITSGTSANAEIGPSLSRLRARSRDLVRNNPWAASAVRKLAAKCIGTGIVPRLAAARDDDAAKRDATAEWDAFAEACDPSGQVDFYGLQRLVARTMFESGEALVRFIPRPSSWGLRVPLQLQVLEGDYLDSSKTQVLDSGSLIVQGVEFDSDGRRVAYWLFDAHPGDAMLGMKGALAARRVPAADVLHVFDPLRPGQARGVPIFAPVVLKLRDLDDLDDAEILRRKIGACFAAFVHRAAGPQAGPLAGKAATTDEAGRRLEKFTPGTVQYLGEGEEITFATPPDAEGYLDAMTAQLRAVAAGTGVTYEMLTGDLSKVNYSSLRAGMVDFWDLVDGWQWQVFVHQFCRPVWARFAGVLAATGRRPLDQPFRAVWTPPRRRWVDPVKEVQATRDAIRAGLMTQAEAIAEMGADPDAQLDEIAQVNAALDAKGIVLDSDPRRVARAGAGPVITEDPKEEQTDDDASN